VDVAERVLNCRLDTAMAHGDRFHGASITIVAIRFKSTRFASSRRRSSIPGSPSGTRSRKAAV
jgi:hypothetical protein